MTGEPVQWVRGREGEAERFEHREPLSCWAVSAAGRSVSAMAAGTVLVLGLGQHLPDSSLPGIYFSREMCSSDILLY